MNNECWFSQDQCRKQTAQADVILKKQITPAKQSNQFRNWRSPAYSIIRFANVISGRLRNDVNFVAGSREFFGQDF